MLKAAHRKAFIKAAQEATTNFRGGTCCWIHTQTGKEDEILKWDGRGCHAQLVVPYQTWCPEKRKYVVTEGTKGISQIRQIVPQSWKNDEKHFKDMLKFWEWLLKESPWRQAFLNKDVRNGLVNGFAMDCSQPYLYVHGASIVFREPWEHKQMLKAWIKLVDMGVDKTIAHIIANAFDYKGEDKFNFIGTRTHNSIDGCSTDPKKYLKNTPKHGSLVNICDKQATDYEGSRAMWRGAGKSELISYLEKLPSEQVKAGFGYLNYVRFTPEAIEHIKKETLEYAK